MDTWRRRGWSEVDNGDLWELADSLLRGRAADSVRFVKVKGHATRAEVRGGQVRQEVWRQTPPSGSHLTGSAGLGSPDAEGQDGGVLIKFPERFAYLNGTFVLVFPFRWHNTLIIWSQLEFSDMFKSILVCGWHYAIQIS